MEVKLDEKFLSSLEVKELIGIIKVMKYNYLTLKLENHEMVEFYEKKVRTMVNKIDKLEEEDQ